MADKPGFASGNEDARDRWLSSSYGRFSGRLDVMTFSQFFRGERRTKVLIVAPNQIQGFAANLFIDTVIRRTATVGRCKCGRAISPLKAYQTLYVANAEL